MSADLGRDDEIPRTDARIPDLEIDEKKRTRNSNDEYIRNRGYIFRDIEFSRRTTMTAQAVLP